MKEKSLVKIKEVNKKNIRKKNILSVLETVRETRGAYWND